MERKVQRVEWSRITELSVMEVYTYGAETFGFKAADIFLKELLGKISALNKNYFLHPECRHLPTKSKKYRNIILGAYLVKYKITDNQIEVLKIFHSSISPSKIKTVRSIKLG